MSAYELSVAAELVAQAHRNLEEAITILRAAGHEDQAVDLERTSGIVDLDVKILVGERNIVRRLTQRAGA